MTLEIFNSKGDLVGTADPGKKKGVNTVNWDYKVKPPIAPKGQFNMRGIFTSTQLPEGDYKVVLTKGKDVYESSIKLIYDPNTSFSLEDRKLKSDLIKNLFDLTQDLAYLVFEIDETMSYINAIDFGKDKNSKIAKTLTNELNSLKNSLVVTSGDNYVQAADPGLKEFICDLYNVVAGNTAKPSNTHFNNYEMLKKEFATAKEKLDFLLKKDFVKIEKFAEKNSLQAIKLKSFEEFLKQ